METPEGLAVCDKCFDKTPKPVAKATPTVVYAGLRTETRDTKVPLVPITNPAVVGGKNTCPRCHKEAYTFEQVPGPLATVYHKKCLTCAGTGCKKALDSFAKMDGGLPYCVGCNDKIKKDKK
jgi:hypothetical protein